MSVDILRFLVLTYKKLGLQGWPVHKPDILVSTPAALLNNIDPDKRRCLEFMRGVKYVVCFLCN